MNEPAAHCDPPLAVDAAPWLDQWAQRIAASGWAALAVVLLETFRPWGFLGSQLVLLVEPLLGTGIRSTAQRLGWLMEDPARVERLLISIEAQHVHR
jgi:hypothetical protein